MSDAAKRRRQINRGRRALGLPVIAVGFDYAQAILEINTKKDGRYTLKQIAKCLGVSEGAVEKYKRGESIPDHLGGEALWGLYQDVFGKCFQVTPEQKLGGDAKTYLGKAKVPT